MKSINFKNISVLALSTLLCFNACDVDKLDTPPIGVTEITYFETEDDYIAVVVGVYAGLTNWYAMRGYAGHDPLPPLWILPGDDITIPSSWQLGNFETFIGISPSSAKVSPFFGETYKIIQRANVLIEQTAKADKDAFSPNFIDNLRGEALFMRALSNFYLYNIYGTAPLVTKRILDRADANIPRSEGVQLLDQVITDLREAAPLLPQSWPDKFTGRATKNSAYGLLVKALVYRGDYTNSTGDYADAVTAYGMITQDRMLERVYTDNFSAYHENNMESLFEFQSNMISPDNENNPWIANDNGGAQGVATMAAYWGYYKANGQNNFYDNWIHGGDYFKVTQKMWDDYGKDPRIANLSLPGREFLKYGRTDLDIPVPGKPVSLNNVRMLRLADIMLLAAEANLLTGNTAAAIDLINQVRARANSWGMSLRMPDGEPFPEGTFVFPEPLNTAEQSTATIMQWIEDERAIELLGEEGNRWWDLKRWDARGYKSLQGWTGSHEHFSTDMSGGFQFEYPKHLVYPIPQDEVERNTAINGNNPGY